MQRLICCLITVYLSVAFFGTASAESLFPLDSNKTIYADKKACKVGDVVTVMIIETSSSSQQAATNTKKESELKTNAGVGPLLKEIPPFEFSGGDSMKASGQTSRSSKLIANMTAKVVKIDNNGNLVIEGTHFIQTNKEKEEIKLSGTVRPQDVTPNNTVMSTNIADLKITHVGSGPLGSRQKEGIITKIFKILF